MSTACARRGSDVELIDAKAIGLPMLDRMYKEHPKGQAPAVLEQLAGKIRDGDGFVFVTGEYNWGMQPGLKNLTDHFLEEWFWRPAAIASYSAGRFSGARAAMAWHGTLSEMGMVVISSSIAVGPIGQTLDGRRQTDRRGRQGADARVSALCRRSGVVGGGGEGPAGEEGAAVLMRCLRRHGACRAMLGVPFRPRAAHIVALGPVAVKSAADHTAPFHPMRSMRHSGMGCAGS